MDMKAGIKEAVEAKVSDKATVGHLAIVFGYVNGPVTFDKFKDHTARRAYLQSIAYTAAWHYLRTNKLRVNNIQCVLKVLLHQHLFFKVVDEAAANEAAWLAKRLQEEYQRGTNSEKMGFVEDLDFLICTFLGI